MREVGLDSLNVSVASALLCARFLEREEGREGRGKRAMDEEGLLF